MTNPIPFDPGRLIRELHDGGVRFVVIGGIAGRLLGSDTVTNDLDVCYATDRENLEALASVLRRLNARHRGVDADVPFRLDARTLAAGDSFTFSTDAGAFDIVGTPSGTNGYDDLARSAQPQKLEGRRVLVTSIDDLLRMKRSAGRAKDRIELEILSALRDEIDKGS